MKNIKLVSMLSFVFGLMFSMSICAEGYPINEKDRGLVLQRNTGEISIGPAWLGGNENRDMEPYFNFRYSLTENLEIARIGLRYRFINSRNQQWAFRIQNYGIGTNSGGFYYHTEFGVDGKRNINALNAVLYNIGYYRNDSNERDGKTNEFRLGIGWIFKMSPKTSVDVIYYRRYFSGFNISSANLAKLNLNYNISPKIDAVLTVGRSDFNESIDSVLFNESYENMISLGVKLRF